MGITSNDIAAQRAMLARGEEKRKAAKQAAERERLRDTFAAVALPLCTRNGRNAEQISESAYKLADAMLRERGNHSAKPNSSTNHDAVPEAKADLPDERPPNAVSANGGTPGAASRDGSGTGNTPSDAEIDALEFVVYAGGIANGWDKDILRQWLIRLRPEFDSAEAIKEGDSDRSQPIGSPAKTNPTQPRNGTPVEGSVPGEGSVPDSRSENEPVAWAVMQNDWYHDAHLDYYKAVKLATAANVAPVPAATAAAGTAAGGVRDTRRLWRTTMPLGLVLWRRQPRMQW